MSRFVIFAVAVMVTLAGAHALRGVEQQQPADPQQQQAAAAPDAEAAAAGVDPEVAALRRTRVMLARQALDYFQRQRTDGTYSLESLSDEAEWHKRLADAEIAASVDDGLRRLAAERYVANSREILAKHESLFKAGRVRNTEMLASKYRLAEAECMLAELKAR